MRLLTAGALALALAACGGASEGDELAASNSQLSPSQVDAALGPADQSVTDSFPSAAGEDGVSADGNEANAASASNAADGDEE